MRILRIFWLLFSVLTLAICTTTLQSCKPDEEQPCDTCTMAYKPNIYIYPTERVQLSVQLEFPMGGEVMVSIPEYGQGWDVSVDTSGLIDDTYTYLFYESRQPDIWQNSEGWIVSRTGLESFFVQNMHDYGFSSHEITDFTDYWIPQLKDYEYYSICPQNDKIINNVISIQFSQQPDNILRLFYVVRGFNLLNGPKLKEPEVPSQFKREGLYVTEWGVIL